MELYVVSWWTVWYVGVSVSHSVASYSRNPMDCSPSGSSVHGILQARILEWIAIPFSRRSSRLRDRTWVSCIAGRFFTLWAIRKPMICELYLNKTFSKGKYICSFVRYCQISLPECANLHSHAFTVYSTVLPTDYRYTLNFCQSDRWEKWFSIFKKLAFFCEWIWTSFLTFIYLFNFFLLYNIVLVLPYINMNPPWVDTCSQSRTPLPPFLMFKGCFYIWFCELCVFHISLFFFWSLIFLFYCCSVIKSTLCDPMDYSMPGFPVLHYLRSLLKLMSIELVMPFSHLILCRPLLLLPSVFPSIRVFSNESAFCIW